MAEITPIKVREEIDGLLENPLSYTTAERLVTLFKLKKYLCEFWEEKGEEYIADAKVVAYPGSSEYVRAASKCPVDELVGIMDEHMEWLREAHPKMYAMTMELIEKAGER